MSRRSILIPSAVSLALLAAAAPALAGTQDAKSKHVLLLSVDGIHDDEVLVRVVRMSHRADAYG